MISLQSTEVVETKRKVIMLLPRFGGRVDGKPGVSPGNAMANIHVFMDPGRVAGFLTDVAVLGKDGGRHFQQNYFPSDFSCVNGLLSAAEDEKKNRADVLSKMPAGSFFLEGLLNNLRGQSAVLERSSTLADVTVTISRPQGPAPKPDLTDLSKDYFNKPYSNPMTTSNYYLRLGVADTKIALQKSDEIFSHVKTVRADLVEGSETLPFPHQYSRVTYRMPARGADEVSREVQALGNLTGSDTGNSSPSALIDEINWRISMLEKINSSEDSAGFMVDRKKLPTMIADLKKLLTRFKTAPETAQFTIDFYPEKSR